MGRFGRIKKRVERLNAQVGRLKPRFEAIKLRVRYETYGLKETIPISKLRVVNLKENVRNF